MTSPSGLMCTEQAKQSTDGVNEPDAGWVGVFRELAQGRISALDELYELAATDVYRLALWRTGSRDDAEDVVQDVFIRVAEQGGRLAKVRHPRRWSGSRSVISQSPAETIDSRPKPRCR